MTISVNSKTLEFDTPLTISQLLDSLNMKGKPVVIELNKEAIFPRNFDSTEINDQDSVEIIVIAAGG